MYTAGRPAKPISRSVSRRERERYLTCIARTHSRTSLHLHTSTHADCNEVHSSASTTDVGRRTVCDFGRRQSITEVSVQG